MHEDILRESRRLPQFGTLQLSGPDARSFLQGQLSTNVVTLTPETVLLSSCNSAQGRVQAVLWIAPRGEELVLVTAAELVEATTARLKKYVLRSKVKFEPATLAVYGRMEGSAATAAWSAPLGQRQRGEINVVGWPGGRTLLIAPAADAAVDDTFVRAWRLADIRAGIPALHTQTHERFVAQMLNLDVLGGISFDKGCYTGQEIIARMHYRGTVKRRMFRYAANIEPPAPGTRILAGEEPAGEVVTSVETDAGCELLAVVQLSHLEQELRTDAVGSAILKPLPLPYSELRPPNADSG